MQDSKTLIFIFRFSNINSVLFVLFATIPPTFAAAFIKISGFVLSINFLVSSKLNRSASSLVAGIMLYPSFSFARVDFNDDPTKPLLPKIKTLILIPLTSICNCIF